MSHFSQQPAGGLRGDIYSQVTDKVIAQIEGGVLPWVQPWAGGPALSLPKNASTQKAYSGPKAAGWWENMTH
jgi:antirestriction protein ArdC